MTTPIRASIEIRFSDDTVLTQWETITVRERFDDALGSYSFTVKPTFEKLFDFQLRLMKGELVRVYVDGHPYATPIIESVATSVDRSGSVKMQVECKSVLLAATEASADPQIYQKQQADVPVSGLVLDVLKPFGFTSINTDAAGNVKVLTGKGVEGRAPAITADTLKAKDAAVNDNETCYGYLARLYSRLGVALRVTYENELLLQEPGYDQHPSYSVMEGQGDETGFNRDRALSITLRETNSGQFSKVVILGKDGEKRGKKQTAKPRAALRQTRLTGPLGPSLTAETGFDIEAFAQARWDVYAEDQPFENVKEESFASDFPLYTSSLHPFKPKYYVDKRSRDNERCASFCKLVHTKNAPNAYEVTVELDGLVAATGAVYAIDTTCDVESTALKLKSTMWVHEVTLTQSRSGSRTTLKLLPLGSFVLGDIPS